MKTILLATVAATALLSSSPLALAAGAGEVPTTIGEIIVTAEKREQSIQKVPVAVTAFTAKTRELIGLDSLQDYTNFTPGLSYSASNDRVFLRGVGRETNTVGSDPGVATYVDGVYNAATASAAGDELFLDRTEILRGPQGTLYGRNSIGGAINAISRRPTSSFYAEARATVGNYGVYNFEGAVSGPISDALRFRLAASRDEQDQGYFKNLAGGPSEGGRGTSHYVEGQLDADLGAHAELWIKAYTQEDQVSPRSTNLVTPYDYAEFPVGGLAPGSAFGFRTPGYVALGACATNPGIVNPRDICTNTPQTAHLQPDDGVSVHFTWRLPSVDVKYIGGFQHYDFKQVTELDNTSMVSYQAPLSGYNYACYALGYYSASTCAYGSPLTVDATQLFRYEENKTFQSHELNISSTNPGPLQWIAGLYYYDEVFDQQDHFAMPDQPQILAPSNGPANPSGDYVYANGKLRTTTYAAFGQVDWAITDTLKLTAGLRYTDDQKKGLERFRAICLGCSASYPVSFYGALSPGLDITASPEIISYAMDPGVVAPPTIDPVTGVASRRQAASWSATTGTAGLSWTPDRDTLAYARYSRGYKSGGFNAGGVSPDPETAPEYVDSYEIGAKRQFGGQLQLNAAAFYYNYTNLQVPLTVNTSTVAMTEFFNLKSAVSYGVELEGVWRPVHPLQFLLSYGYLNATIRKACCFVDGADPYALQPSANPVGPAASNGYREQSVDGQAAPESPRNKIGLNGVYTFDFDPGALSLSASYIWKEQTYDSIFNRPYNLAPSYSQVDLRASWNDARKRYTVIVFAKNVFNTLGYDSVSAAEVTPTALGGYAPAGTVARTVSLTPPRTFGVQLQYRFQ